MKIVYGAIVLIAGIAGFFGIRYLVKIRNYKNQVANLIINEADLSAVKDGTYLGTCDVDVIKATVRVEIKEHRITKIKLLEHKNDRGKDAEKIIDRILQQQKLTVDAISGATNSSKVIQKAIEESLRG
ncbi:FMN-binding protein [Enterococcus sp. 669A]|uniref:FMN-binding protein n=1 Tax=Candidatus Enterococcus moelleringii TaxID=2815325 RepID=A0ABS3LB65_9ENTE|nr:FMN-binding protein [Enterococcus sp. 669A]MBO1306879.1 FMN-binding protein [Enterococcus sp. 669A]